MKTALLSAAAMAATAILCGCPGPSTTSGSGGGGPASWQIVYESDALGGAILSVWGSDPNDVYAVGGPLGNGGEAVALHFDGTAWKKLAPGGSDTFWWVSGSSATDVWMVGEHGRITHFDGSSFTEINPQTTATIWGVWSPAKDDAWAVGGSPGKGDQAPNDIILHWDGTSWSPVTLPATPHRSLNKVWGTSSSDLYAVGEAGTIWHKQGDAFVLEKNPASANLLTVFGASATEIYAVGASDVLTTKGDGTWSKVDVKLTNAANGVTCSGPGAVLVVGFGGLKARLADGVWTNDFREEPFDDLHGAWSDGHAYWAVGGDFLSMPTAGKKRLGVITRYAADEVAVVTP